MRIQTISRSVIIVMMSMVVMCGCDSEDKEVVPNVKPTENDSTANNAENNASWPEFKIGTYADVNSGLFAYDENLKPYLRNVTEIDSKAFHDNLDGTVWKLTLDQSFTLNIDGDSTSLLSLVGTRDASFVRIMNQQYYSYLPWYMPDIPSEIHSVDYEYDSKCNAIKYATSDSMFVLGATETSLWLYKYSGLQHSKTMDTMVQTITVYHYARITDEALPSKWTEERLLAGLDLELNRLEIKIGDDGLAYAPDAPSITREDFDKYVVGGHWQTPCWATWASMEKTYYLNKNITTLLLGQEGVLWYLSVDATSVSELYSDRLLNDQSQDAHLFTKEWTYDSYDEATNTLYHDGEKLMSIVCVSNERLVYIRYMKDENNKPLSYIYAVRPIAADEYPTAWDK